MYMAHECDCGAFVQVLRLGKLIGPPDPPKLVACERCGQVWKHDASWTRYVPTIDRLHTKQQKLLQEIESYLMNEHEPIRDRAKACWYLQIQLEQYNPRGCHVLPDPVETKRLDQILETAEHLATGGSNRSGDSWYPLELAEYFLESGWPSWLLQEVPDLDPRKAVDYCLDLLLRSGFRGFIT